MLNLKEKVSMKTQETLKQLEIMIEETGKDNTENLAYYLEVEAFIAAVKKEMTERGLKI